VEGKLSKKKQNTLKTKNENDQAGKKSKVNKEQIGCNCGSWIESYSARVVQTKDWEKKQAIAKS